VAGSVAFAASPLGAAFPIIATSLAVPILYTCITLAKQHGHIPEWLDTPPISLAGVHEPEATVYRIGFPLIMLALFLIELPVVTLLRAALSSGPEEIGTPPEDGEGRADVLTVLDRASLVARIAFVGLGLQGVIPLQGWGTAATIVHVMSANVFFMLSIYHGACVLWCLSTRTAAEAGDALPVARARDTVAWYLRAAVLVAAFFPMGPAMILHPGTQPVDHDAVAAAAAASGAAGSLPGARSHALDAAEHERSMESAGFSQWWMVGSIITYYALYARDLYLLGRSNAARVSDAQRAWGVGGITVALGLARGDGAAMDGDADDTKTE